MTDSSIVDIGNSFIHARSIDPIKDKPAWEIVNKRSGSPIACVAWYPTWRRYVMLTDTPIALDVGCMKSITQFIEAVSK